MLITKEGSARGENERPTTWLYFFPTYFPEKGKKKYPKDFYRPLAFFFVFNMYRAEGAVRSSDEIYNIPL